MNNRFVPADEAARQQVRTDVDTMMVVEAGAGTGKTSLLTDRVVTLLSKFDIAELVAITFTRKAAGELEERLRLEIARRAVTEEGMIRTRYAQALASIDNASVSTIHAFASGLLRQDPVALGIDPEFEEIDEDDDEELLDETIVEDLTTLSRERYEAIFSLAEFGIKAGKICDLVSQMARYSDLIEKEFPESVEAEISRRLCETSLLADEVAGMILRDGVEKKDEAVTKVFRCLERRGSLAGEVNIAVAVEWLEEAASFDPRKGTQDRWENPAACKSYKQNLKLLKDEAIGALEAIRWSLLRRTLNALKPTLKRFREAKRERGVASFDDLLLAALDLLNDPAALDAARDRCKRLLIDEFQDTDPRQVKLALRIAGIEGEARSDFAGRLSVVGDPKQSIYRFRGADAGVFASATDHISRFGRMVNIVQNFRSADGIISFVNDFFSRVWRSTTTSGDPGYAPLEPLPETSGAYPSPPVHFIIPGEGVRFEFSRSAEARLAEADAIARTILEVVNGKWLKIVRKKSGEAIAEAVGWADIAMLFPTMTDLDLYTASLEKYQIPFVVGGGRMAFRRQLATDLLNLITALDDPSDELSVIGALRSQLLSVGDDDIYDWKRLGGGFDYLNPPTGLSAGLTAALDFLRSKFHRGRIVEPAELIGEIVRELDIEASLLSVEGGELDLQLLESVQLQAAGYTADQGGLRAFRRKLERLIRKGDNPDPTPPGEGAAAVQLLTVHAAKGLEFPVVVLANLQKGKNHTPPAIPDWTNGTLHIRLEQDKRIFQSPGYAAAHEHEKLEIEAERTRLLYVAMTRARDHLIIPLYRAEKRESDHQRFLADYLTGMGVFEGAPLAAARIIDASRLTSTPVTSRAQTSPTAGEVIAQVESFSAERRTAQANLNVTPRRIIRPSEAVMKSTDPEISGAEPADSEPLRIGRALHRYLSIAPLELPLDHTLLSAVCLKESIAVEVVAPLVSNCLASEVCQGAASAHRFWREVPITLDTGEGIMKGVIDLMWQDSQGLSIADYKSGAGSPSSYAPQLAHYAEAVERITGERVVKRWIVTARDGSSFLMPDGELR